MPPATDASKPISTPCFSASASISFPSVAISALFAVTTCLLFLMALSMSSFAGCMPPISSITILISGSLSMSSALVVKIPSGSLIPPALFYVKVRNLFQVYIKTGSLRNNVFVFKQYLSRSVPTVPNPIMPTLIIRQAPSLFPLLPVLSCARSQQGRSARIHLLPLQNLFPETPRLRLLL